MSPVVPAGKVLVLGEALVDEFADGPVAGGAPLNVARSLAALGCPVLLASRLGDGDAAGRVVLQSMRRFGLSEAGLQLDPVHATGRVSVIEDGPGGAHRFEIHVDAAWDHIDAGPIAALADAEPPALVYFGSLAQRHPVSRDSLQFLLHRLGGQGRLRYLDLNLRPGSSTPELAAACLQLADWVKVNDDEFEQLAHWFALPADEAVAARALLQRFGGQRLILTRGSAGYAAYDAFGQLLAEGPGVAVPRLVDTVGAGDAFSAMLLAASLGGQAPEAALRLANGMAAALCGERGPVPAEDGFYAPWRAALEGRA